MDYFQKICSGRIGRKSYILGSLIIFLLSLFLLFLQLIFLYFLSSTLWSSLIFSLSSLIFYSTIVIIFWLYTLPLHFRRLHDIGKGGWWILLSLFTPYYLWLIFQEGNANKNQYGDVPSKNVKLLTIIFGVNKLNGNFIKTNWFKLGILISLLIIACSVFFYFVIYIPKEKRIYNEYQSKQRLEEQKKELLNERLLDICLSDAITNGKTKAETLMNAVVGTQTPTDRLQWMLEDISNWVKSEKDNCYKKYPQK